VTAFTLVLRGSLALVGRTTVCREPPHCQILCDWSALSDPALSDSLCDLERSVRSCTVRSSLWL